LLALLRAHHILHVSRIRFNYAVERHVTEKRKTRRIGSMNVEENMMISTHVMNNLNVNLDLSLQDSKKVFDILITFRVQTGSIAKFLHGKANGCFINR